MRPVARPLYVLVVALGLGGAGPVAGRQDPVVPPKPAAAVPPAPVAAPAGTVHLEIPDQDAATCLTCHEGLDKAKVPHAPVEAGMCATCHEFSGKGDDTRVAFAASASREDLAPLCLTCHEELAASLKAEHAHGPAAAGECATCHSPHGSDRERLLTAPQAELCTTCHDDVAGQLSLAHPHAPVTVSCAVCHDPHGNDRPAKIRAAVNDLCLACHLFTETPGAGSKATLFDRSLSSETAPLASPEKVIRLDRLKQVGHPLMRHPVAGPKDPVEPAKMLTCLSCHVPHGAGGPALQRYAENSPDEACAKCH